MHNRQNSFTYQEPWKSGGGTLMLRLAGNCASLTRLLKCLRSGCCIYTHTHITKFRGDNPWRKAEDIRHGGGSVYIIQLGPVLKVEHVCMQKKMRRGGKPGLYSALLNPVDFSGGVEHVFNPLSQKAAGFRKADLTNSFLLCPRSAEKGIFQEEEHQRKSFSASLFAIAEGSWLDPAFRTTKYHDRNQPCAQYMYSTWVAQCASRLWLRWGRQT